MNHTFKTIIFDFDSTLSSIEGINELARINGKLTQVSKLTKKAMGGNLKFEDIFFKRLKIIQPTFDDLREVAILYRHSIIPGSKETIAKLKSQGRKVLIISGGYKQAILPSAEYLGINSDDVWAPELAADSRGYLTQINPNHIQPTHTGKRDLINWLKPQKKVIFVGDGTTDLMTKPVVDLFIGFGGVKVRHKVRKRADHYITTKSLLPILDIIKQEESKPNL